MSCLFKELLYFDPSKDHINIENQILLGVFVMLISNIISVVIMKLFKPNIESIIKKENTQTFQKFYDRNISPKKLLGADILNSVLYAPISEELFFRYFLLKTLLTRKFNLNIHTSIIIQAALFGVFHVTNQVYTDQKNFYTNVQMFSSFISGILNGYVYYYSNSIVPCVVSHMLNNFVASFNGYHKYNNYIKKD